MVMALAVLALSAALAGAQTPVSAFPVVERVAAAVGLVTAEGDRSDLRGTGVILSPDGIVVSSYHVIASAANGPSRRILIGLPGTDALYDPPAAASRLRAKVLHTMPEYDLALLRIISYADGRPLPKGHLFPHVPLGSSPGLHLLEPVYVVGFPDVGGNGVTAVLGHVAGKDTANGWIKLDALIARGYSGGAVVNQRGELVGIPTELRADSDSAAGLVRGALSWVRPAELVAALLFRSRNGAKSFVSTDARPRVRGTVSTPTGQPLAGALVALLMHGAGRATTANLVSYTRTASDGSFVLYAQAGKYTLQSGTSGFARQQRDVNVPVDSEIRIVLQPAAPDARPTQESKPK